MAKLNFKNITAAIQAIPNDLQLAYSAIIIGVVLILLAVILW